MTAVRLLGTFDLENYDPSLPRITRSAARAIIFRDGAIALIRSRKYGEFKFPGGGIKPGESRLEALVRETREETGLAVIRESVRDYGMTRERRLDRSGDAIYEHISYYYTCEAGRTRSETELSDREIAFGYRLEFTTLEHAIRTNEQLLGSLDVPWVERELFALRLVSAELGRAGA